MDNKITKKRITRHLEYDWYKYLLIIVLSIALCSYGFYMLNRTRDYERLDVFISCYRSNDSTIPNSFYDTIKSEGDDWMREINVSIGNYAGSSYHSEFEAGTTGDIIIMPKAYMDGQGWDYLELTPEILDCIFTPLSGETDNYDFTAFRNNPDNFYYYEYNEEEGRKMVFADGKCYGIRVDNLVKMQAKNAPFIFDYNKIENEGNNGEDTSGGDVVESEKEYDTEFYLVYCKKSIKLGSYGSNSNYHNLHQAFRFTRYFISRYDQ